MHRIAGQLLPAGRAVRTGRTTTSAEQAALTAVTANVRRDPRATGIPARKRLPETSSE